MWKHAQRFANDDGGTTSIEYGLIALLVAVAIIGAVTLLGSQVRDTFNTVGAAYPKS